MTGVELDWYVTAVAEHRAGLWAAVVEHCRDVDLASVQRVVAERFMADLHGVVLGYREIDAAENAVLFDVLRLVSSASTRVPTRTAPWRPNSSVVPASRPS